MKTHSRDQLIDLSKVLAYSFDIRFFQDPDNIPYILISGVGDGGKSMIVEAMMKTLLDEHDPDHMKRPDASRGMFIEKRPSDACGHYCQAIGHTNGAPVMYGFDRITSGLGFNAQSNFVDAFQKAASMNGASPVGAIFTSGDIWNTQPWLVVGMKSTGQWDRSLEIKALNESLISTPQFQYYWNHLESFAKTGKLPKAALLGHAVLPLDIFSKNTAYSEDTHSTNGAECYETELFKFAFWHHDELSLSRAQVAQIAATISDLRGAEKVAPFIDWLKNRGEHNFIAEINGSKSKLTRLVFKYVSVDTHTFDLRKLMQYALRKKEQEIQNPMDRQKKYRSYFAAQLNGPDKEKVRNFLSVIATAVTDEDLEQLLRKVFREPKNPHAIRSSAEKRRFDAIGNLYTILDSNEFPLTIKRLNKIYGDGGANQMRMQTPAPQPAL